MKSPLRSKAPKFLFIRSAVLLPIIEHFGENLGAISKIISQNGVSVTVIDDPYAPIPLSSYLQMFEQAAEATGDPVLGARLGFGSRPGNIAPIGLLAIQLATIERALGAIVRYTPALQSGTQMALERDEDRLILSYLITAPVSAPLRQDAEFTLASTCCLIRGAFDLRWRPLEIHFCHPAPEQTARTELRKLFGAPVLFGQPVNRIVMSAVDARRAHRAEDKDMIAMTERHLADLIEKTHRPASVSEQVEALVAMYLGNSPISLETIAAAMQIPPRSLQRKLSEENRTLSGIVQRHRQSKANALLADGAMSVEAVATALGYADGTAFWRAYRGWTGRSPSRHRNDRIAPTKSDFGGSQGEF